MKNRYMLITLFLISITFISCQKGGYIGVLEGDVWINGAKGKAGDRLKEKDIIKTGKTSTAIASFNNNESELEIQENALIEVKKYGLGKNEEKLIFLSKGNMWTRVNRLLKNNSYHVQTSSSVAAVRGTKFYTFTIGNMDGVCHCEGTVDYSQNESDYNSTHSQDYIVINRGGKTVLLTPEELSFLSRAHDHSTLSDSSLGNKSEPLSEEESKRFLSLIESKM